jgi:hypothetical protein
MRIQKSEYRIQKKNSIMVILAPGSVFSCLVVPVSDMGVGKSKALHLISLGLIPRGLPRVVIPAKAGIQEFKLDAGSCPA